MRTNAAAPTTAPVIIPGRLPGKQGRRFIQSLVKNLYDHYSTWFSYVHALINPQDQFHLWFHRSILAMDPNWCCVHYYYYWTSSLVVNDWLKTEGQTLWQWKKTFMYKVASGDKKFNIAERDFESAHSLLQLNWWVTCKWTLRDVTGLLGSPDWIS